MILKNNWLGKDCVSLALSTQCCLHTFTHDVMTMSYFLPFISRNLVDGFEQPALRINLLFVFQRSHQKVEDSEESSDEILARLTSAVRQLPYVMGEIMRTDHRREAV